MEAALIDYTLYLIAARASVRAASLEQAVYEACAGGVTLVQLREKRIAHDEHVALARRVQAICGRFGVPLVINDDIEVALETGAAGVHLGQSDAPVQLARERLGACALVGMSAHTCREAREAQDAGADYLGVGALAPSSTKRDARIIEPTRLAELVSAVDIPCVGIGGVDEAVVERCGCYGLAGFAVASALLGSADVAGRARSLRRAIRAARDVGGRRER